MTTDTPKFRREYDDKGLYRVHDSSMMGAAIAQELIRCYEIIDSAVEMAETVYGMVSSDEKDIFTCQMVSKDFLEKVK